MNPVHNAWYAAAFSSEVGSTILRRVLLGEAVALYRTRDGRCIAVADRCPHRFAPISMGRVTEDGIQCRYHGLRFNADGACIFNPHSDRTPATMRLRVYPAFERYGVIWVWTGEPSHAKPEAIPNLEYIEDYNAYRTVTIYLKCDFRHDILVDNLLDISHADYLHDGSFSNGPASNATTEVVDEGNTVLVVRRQYDAPPLVDFPEFGRCDVEIRTRWHLGHVLTFDLRVTKTGHSLDEGKLIRFVQAITPLDNRHCHYFMLHSRDFALIDPELDAVMAREQRDFILAEDVPMLEAIQSYMGDCELYDLRPVTLPVDKGPILMRKKMKALAEKEQAFNQTVSARHVSQFSK